MNQIAEIKKGRKFDQVVEGARKVFMADGFEGASVDTIAKSAGVSKATLYSYFPDKRLLFMEVASTECRRQATRTVDEIDLDGAPAIVLPLVGRRIMDFMLSPFGQRVFRICVAECDRFPELGQRFWESGPGLIESVLGSYLDRATERGELAIEDTTLAAHQFGELCKSQLFPRFVFGMQTSFSSEEMERVLASAVEMFLARYGTAGSVHPPQV